MIWDIKNVILQIITHTHKCLASRSKTTNIWFGLMSWKLNQFIFWLTVTGFSLKTRCMEATLYTTHMNHATEREKGTAPHTVKPRALSRILRVLLSTSIVWFRPWLLRHGSVYTSVSVSVCLLLGPDSFQISNLMITVRSPDLLPLVIDDMALKNFCSSTAQFTDVTPLDVPREVHSNF